ncbi:metallophosphoesterase [Halomonas sp. GD1P12]|uniref:metallophosphoesterase n=1 Tax=Halomonas sp. GD1P12 TaxID=2982691 RepID=UPI0021E44550|nr:metallophosphoesterase [Halomonas sp. GD1P12]UYF98648.1 metallophosphoesterase [Halomonas sp. GD1P12]
MRLIQITDAHLYADKHARSRTGVPWRQFERVLEAVIQERPDVVLLSGDVSQDETLVSYQHACQALARLPCPWFWIPGNHDQVEFMAECHPLLSEVDLGEWRLLLLDTRVEGKPHGELGAEQLEALVERLESSEQPTVVGLHHPPVDVGAAWMDAIGLLDRDAFWQVLERFPLARVLLFGHAHQGFAQTLALGDHEVSVYGCPALADQFMPGALEFAVDQASRPGYRVVELRSGGEWQTWIERVGM